METVMEVEHSRSGVLLFLMLAAFLAGMAVGQFLESRERGHSRIGWPSAPVPHPRSLQP
jgi:hypothetical protein